MSNPLNDFGLKIFLDRYAHKDTTKATLALDDTVVVCVDQKTRQREVGKVVALIENPGNKPRVAVKLLDGTDTTQDWDDVDKPLETTPEQTMARTARGIAGVEAADKREEWEEKFKWLLDEWRFVPGGRILAGAGTDQNLTYFNCFAYETPVHIREDSVEKLVEIGTLAGKRVEVLSFGGEYRQAEFKSYGRQSLLRVEFSTGDVVYATPEHEWVIGRNPDTQDVDDSKMIFDIKQPRVPTKDLQPGHAIPFTSYKRAQRLLPTSVRFPVKAGAGDNPYKHITPHHVVEDDARFYGEVVSVTETDRVEEVYCCDEQETHTLTVGNHGFLTGNCYVIPSPKDSRGGIVETLENMMEIMSRGGGVGINLSSLRPRHGYVKGVNGRSSGSISWGGLYSFVTGLIEQGGSRRGALMLILNLSHPDIVDFIDAKREAGKITNANISVAVPDAFMAAVEVNGNWELVFPDTSHPAYDAEWDGDIDAWRAKGYDVVVHKTVKARELWRKISASAHASAEPGILFSDRVNTMSNSHYYSKLICTNPCGEQPLPAWGICNLGAINLGVHVRGGKVQWQELEKTVRYAVRFLDNVIDATPYFIEENKAQQQRERRVGLGIMGLAEMLVRCGIRYGSDECTKFVDKLGKHIAVAAYNASSEYAAEKGSFPAFDAEKLLQSGFMLGMPDAVRERIRENGLRNVTLLTVAPTGTTGTMVDTSTGVEPYFAWTYFRKSRLGMNEIEVNIVQEWRAANPDVKELPDHFVTAMELSPEDHVRTQAALQRWIDSALSKTCNAPNEYTVEQVQELYELMYKLGCKGGTIYRDGSRDEQVLMLKKDEPTADVVKPAEVPRLRKRPAGVLKTLNGKHMTHLGSCYSNVTLDRAGEPLEVFVTSGKAGSDVSAMAEGLGRLASLVLSIPSAMSPQQRLALIGEQLEGIGGSDSVGFGKAKIKSIPDAVGKAILQIVEDLEKDQVSAGVVTPIAHLEAPAEPAKQKRAKRAPAPDMCPKCGQATYIREEGCMHCTSCAHSACG